LNNFDDIPGDLCLPETQYGMDPTYDPPPPGIKIESLRRIIRKLIKENIFKYGVNINCNSYIMNDNVMFTLEE